MFRASFLSSLLCVLPSPQVRSRVADETQSRKKRKTVKKARRATRFLYKRNSRTKPQEQSIGEFWKVKKSGAKWNCGEVKERKKKVLLLPFGIILSRDIHPGPSGIFWIFVSCAKVKQEILRREFGKKKISRNFYWGDYQREYVRGISREVIAVIKLEPRDAISFANL